MIRIPVQGRESVGQLFALGVALILLGVLFGIIVENGPISAAISSSLTVLGVITIYVVDQSTRPPFNDMASFAKEHNLQEKQMDFAVLNACDEVQPPVLLCLGDSLTHGRASSNYVDCIEPLLRRRMEGESFPSASKIGVALSKIGRTPKMLLRVINAGQNNICSWTILHERIPFVIACKPDFVTVLIGTNDMRGLYRADWANELVKGWNFPSGVKLSLDAYEANLTEAIDKLLRALPSAQIAICTLPPMGEDLYSRSNKIVHEANDRIKKIVSKFSLFGHAERIKVLNIFQKMETILAPRQVKLTCTLLDHMAWHAAWMGLAHYLFGVSWNDCSTRVGNKILTDGLHLNQIGANMVANEIVQWLVN